MTNNDKKLIEDALKLDYINWGTVDNLIAKADTPEAKERLRKIQSILYRNEEYFAECN